MKKRFISIFSFLALAIACFSGFAMNNVHADAAASSRAECVIEVSSKRILSGRNQTQPLPMASTTKVLTACIILEDCDIDKVIKIPAEGVGIEGSSVYLKANEEFSIRDLLYGLMLRSGNDCAVTLALHHSGSIEKFARVMNERAAAMGAEDSYFANPHGLPHPKHHTTARDLAVIAAHAMENPAFCEIVSTKYYEPRGYYNKNKMLANYDGAIGVKTGFTMEAGRCLVTSAERGGMKLVSVVLNSPQMYERSAQLLDTAFENYHMTTLCNRESAIDKCRCLYDFIYPLTAAEEEKIVILTDLVSPLPTIAGEFAGQMKIMLENNLLFSQNLYIME